MTLENETTLDYKTTQEKENIFSLSYMSTVEVNHYDSVPYLFILFVFLFCQSPDDDESEDDGWVCLSQKKKKERKTYGKEFISIFQL